MRCCHISQNTSPCSGGWTPSFPWPQFLLSLVSQQNLKKTQIFLFYCFSQILLIGGRNPMEDVEKFKEHGWVVWQCLRAVVFPLSGFSPLLELGWCCRIFWGELGNFGICSWSEEMLLCDLSTTYLLFGWRAGLESVFSEYFTSPCSVISWNCLVLILVLQFISHWWYFLWLMVTFHSCCLYSELLLPQGMCFHLGISPLPWHLTGTEIWMQLKVTE